MQSLTMLVSALESRRDKVAKEIAKIDSRLTTLARSLGSSRSRVRTAQTDRRQWFAQGEAPQLLRRFARTPKPPADLVRTLAAVKGYDRSLSGRLYKRFETAAFMAVNHAVRVGVLKRRRDGALASR